MAYIIIILKAAITASKPHKRKERKKKKTMIKTHFIGELHLHIREENSKEKISKGRK